MTLPPGFRHLPSRVTWETLDREEVWGSLDAVLPDLDPPTQIAIAGEVIARVAALFATAAEQVFEELDATATQDGPAMMIEQFLPYVRQSMEIDFSQFVGGFERETTRGAYAPRLAESEEQEEERTIVAIVDPVALADAVEGLEVAQPVEFDLEAALELAHIEDVEAWARAIAAYFETTEKSSISLQTLGRSLDLPWIELWLGILLGGYPLERRGEDFYEGEIWVHQRDLVTSDKSSEQNGG